MIYILTYSEKRKKGRYSVFYTSKKERDMRYNQLRNLDNYYSISRTSNIVPKVKLYGY